LRQMREQAAAQEKGMAAMSEMAGMVPNVSKAVEPGSPLETLMGGAQKAAAIHGL
jgi:hypothetical protein